jgi:parallel beta-helix repeat protein
LVNSGAWDIVQLDTDLVDVGGTCVWFSGATSVVFDCDGHLIDGDDINIDPEYGIHIYGGSFEITVRNCTVSDFSAGIQLWNASDCSVENSVFVSNGSGIYAAYLTGTSFWSNISTDNFTGLHLLDSADNNSFDFLESCGNSVADIFDDGASGNSGVCTRCDSPGNWNGSPSGDPMCSVGCNHIFSHGFEFQIECWSWSTSVGGDV